MLNAKQCVLYSGGAAGSELLEALAGLSYHHHVREDGYFIAGFEEAQAGDADAFGELYADLRHDLFRPVRGGQHAAGDGEKRRLP